MSKREEQNHLKWIYQRLIHVHNENPDSDYMLKLQEIIDNHVKNDWENVIDFYLCSNDDNKVHNRQHLINFLKSNYKAPEPIK